MKQIGRQNSFKRKILKNLKTLTLFQGNILKVFDPIILMEFISKPNIPTYQSTNSLYYTPNFRKYDRFHKRDRFHLLQKF